MKMGNMVFVLNSGKMITVTYGVVGLIETFPDRDLVFSSDKGQFNINNLLKEDKLELSDIMIDIWTRFKNDI